MAEELNFSKLRTSWTKYDIVRVMEVIYNKETLQKYKNQEAGIDEPILRSFLGVKSLSDPLPKYWLDIQNYPKDKNLFALFAVIFTHGEVMNKFANEYSTDEMKGVFKMERGKQFTNIRSALIESGAAAPFLRRSDEVPYDFASIFQNLEVGRLFRQVLEERIRRIGGEFSTDDEFFTICYVNDFHKVLSLTQAQFKSWIEGTKIGEKSFINQVHISGFFFS